MYYYFVHFSYHYLLMPIYVFSIIFLKLKSIRFQKIIEIKLLGKSIVSKNDEEEAKKSGHLKKWTSLCGFCKSSASQLPDILIFPNDWNKQILVFNIFPWCKTCLTSKIGKIISCWYVLQLPPTDEHFDFSRCLKYAFPRWFCFLRALYFNVLKWELGHKYFDQI